MSGFPASDGSRRTSTAAKKQSMSTCRIVASLRRIDVQPAVVGAHHRDRAQLVTLDLVAVGARHGPALGQPRAERLTYPRLALLEVYATVRKCDKAGIDDDAIGVVDGDVA